jgi:hypothetical protein
MDRNAQILQTLYAKIAAAFSIGTADQTARPGQGFLTLCNPGIILDPTLDLTKADNRFMLSRQLDAIPAVNWIYDDSGNRVADLYNAILQFKSLPNLSLTPAEQQALKNAQAVVMTADGKPSFKMTQYNKYADAFDVASSAFYAAQQTALNQGTAIPQDVVRKYNKAKSDWATFGYRFQVESAQATIANLTQLDINRWWNDLQNNYGLFNDSSSAGAAFKPVDTFPAYESIFNDAGWTTLTFDERDISNQHTFQSSSWGAGGGVNWGLWRAEASYHYSSSQSYSRSDATAISISMEVKRVTLLRPWMDALVFRSRSWKWATNAPFQNQPPSISDGGDPSKGIAPHGDMPFLPTGFIAARNVKVNGAFSEAEQRIIDSAHGGSTSVGWGPFALSGTYHRQEHSDWSHAVSTGSGFVAPTPQILGFLCTVLPICPYPDPSYPWLEQPLDIRNDYPHLTGKRVLERTAYFKARMLELTAANKK